MLCGAHDDSGAGDVLRGWQEDRSANAGDVIAGRVDDFDMF